jgi:hypothetical protein
MRNRKPGAVSRPGAILEFQFHKSTDLGGRVKFSAISCSMDWDPCASGHRRGNSVQATGATSIRTAAGLIAAGA